MTLFYWLFYTPFIFSAGFVSHIALMEMKRIRHIHDMLNLLPPSPELAETIRCNVENNKRFEQECVDNRRKSFKIVN